MYDLVQSPFSLNVSTDVARCFLKAVHRHCPKKSPFHKIFNRNNVKVSYSTMPNMQSIIRGHNNRILKEDRNDQQPAEAKSCNCRIKPECPMHGQRLDSSIVYRADGIATQLIRNSSMACIPRTRSSNDTTATSPYSGMTGMRRTRSYPSMCGR